MSNSSSYLYDHISEEQQAFSIPTLLAVGAFFIFIFNFPLTSDASIAEGNYNELTYRRITERYIILNLEMRIVILHPLVS